MPMDPPGNPHGWQLPAPVATLHATRGSNSARAGRRSRHKGASRQKWWFHHRKNQNLNQKNGDVPNLVSDLTWIGIWLVYSDLSR